MGKTGRKKRSEERKTRKKAAKAAKRSLYASYAGTGRKKKKTDKKAGPTAQKGNHSMANCGNIGCERCFPRSRKKTTVKPAPVVVGETIEV